MGKSTENFYFCGLKWTIGLSTCMSTRGTRARERVCLALRGAFILPAQHLAVQTGSLGLVHVDSQRP